jgi:hypothetical protein
MAAKKSELTTNGLTYVVTPEVKEEEPTVEVFLPELPGGGDGVKVDQYEHVTIANEEKETCYKVHRGERVPVKIPVFMALYERYGKKIASN